MISFFFSSFFFLHFFCVPIFSGDLDRHSGGGALASGGDSCKRQGGEGEPGTTIYVPSHYYTYVNREGGGGSGRHSTICVLILQYMCPHTTICVLTLLYICVLILLYMCPHTTIYVASHYCTYLSSILLNMRG